MVKRGKKTAGISKTRISRGLPTGARLIVADNSGARIVEIISVIGYHGRRCFHVRNLSDDVEVSPAK